MSEILTNNKYYKDIADTIRQMKGVATTYKPREMASALRDMYSTEVEGVPPLTFPSNGNSLLNYRIDGANGGVGDRTANLLDYNWLFDYEQKKVNEYFNYIQITLEPNTTYNVTSDYNYNQAQNATAFIVVNSNTAITTANGGVFGSLTVTTTQDGILKIARRIKGNNEAMIPKREDFENNSKHIQISINSVNDGNYEPYGYKIPVVIRGKNLLQNTATSQTINGITVTVNDDKSINLSGTSSELTYVDINTNFNSSELAGYYLKLIFPENYVSATSSIIVRISSQNSRTSLQDFTTTKLINDNGNNNRLAIRINGNYTIPDNFKLYLMVSQNSNDNYEPYIEPTTTNIYLDEPIEVNESKSLSDTNVNISTIDGTNILSIDTTVQPSNVYVQAPKTNNYNL